MKIYFENKCCLFPYFVWWIEIPEDDTNSPDYYIKRISDLICNYEGISIETMLHRIRNREIVRVRQLCMFFSHLYVTQTTLGFIGLWFNKRDHSTVLHSCKVISNLIETDFVFRKKVIELNNHLFVNINFPERVKFVNIDEKYKKSRTIIKHLIREKESEYSSADSVSETLKLSNEINLLKLKL